MSDDDDFDPPATTGGSHLQQTISTLSSEGDNEASLPPLVCILIGKLQLTEKVDGNVGGVVNCFSQSML
jgi:hypothetical protein